MPGRDQPEHVLFGILQMHVSQAVEKVRGHCTGVNTGASARALESLDTALIGNLPTRLFPHSPARSSPECSPHITLLVSPRSRDHGIPPFLSCRIFGAQDPTRLTMVQLHGIGGGHWFWRHQTYTIAGRRLVAVDLTGYRASPRPAPCRAHEHVPALLQVPLAAAPQKGDLERDQLLHEVRTRWRGFRRCW
jgi:pimeloyl-ACP methyl ester carboxylesterase